MKMIMMIMMMMMTMMMPMIGSDFLRPAGRRTRQPGGRMARGMTPGAIRSWPCADGRCPRVCQVAVREKIFRGQYAVMLGTNAAVASSDHMDWIHRGVTAKRW